MGKTHRVKLEIFTEQAKLTGLFVFVNRSRATGSGLFPAPARVLIRRFANNSKKRNMQP
jgi:hypothetical protein